MGSLLFGIRMRRTQYLCCLTFLFLMSSVFLWRTFYQHRVGVHPLCDSFYYLKTVGFSGRNKDDSVKEMERDQDNVCPTQSLVGRLDMNGRKDEFGIFSEEALKNVQAGGVFKPKDCKARENVAIIVPYRDREQQLEVFLRHMHTFLQRQNLEYTIYIVELALPAQFNRGILVNAGFLAARNIRRHTCYIVHDVDLLPADDRNLYTCSSSPRHLSVAISTFNYKLPYKENFGGVSAFTDNQFTNINGFPNRYFGWGGEDDDVYERVIAAGYTIERPPLEHGVYEAMPHGRDSRNPKNPERNDLLDNALRYVCYDGLNRKDFTRKAIEFRPLYTWVYISASELEIMERFQ